MTQTEKIENFVAKARLLGVGDFTVDADNSELIRCEPGEYNRLELPPVKAIKKGALKDIEARELIIPETITTLNLSSFDFCTIDTITVLGLV